MFFHFSWWRKSNWQNYIPFMIKTSGKLRWKLYKFHNGHLQKSTSHRQVMGNYWMPFLLYIQVILFLCKKPSFWLKTYLWFLRPDYRQLKAFTWQASLGKAALLTPDLVHSQCTTVSKGSYTQGLRHLWLLCSSHICTPSPGNFILKSLPEALVRALLQVPLSGPSYEEEERETVKTLSTVQILWTLQKSVK